MVTPGCRGCSHCHAFPPGSWPEGQVLVGLPSSLSARTGERERAIFVTSPGPNDGKTTTSLNLAAALAAFNQRVVVVDGDFGVRVNEITDPNG